MVSQQLQIVLRDFDLFRNMKHSYQRTLTALGSLAHIQYAETVSRQRLSSLNFVIVKALIDTEAKLPDDVLDIVTTYWTNKETGIVGKGHPWYLP